MADWIKNLFEWSQRPSPSIERTNGFSSPFVIEFDASLVTDVVKRDLREALGELPDISWLDRRALYHTALEAVMRGGDTHLLFTAITERHVDGIAKHRAQEISRFLCGRANSTMNRERYIALGIELAQWIYSGAPCEGDELMIQSHKAANGEKFPVKTGLKVNGAYTWPGREMGCKCFAKPIIKGFS